MHKLAIITTHPVQYYAPVFRLLYQRNHIDIKVFYTWGAQSVNKFDPGFGRHINWDMNLLDGYPYEWAKNTSAKPGSHHFNGIITPKLIKQIEEYKPNAVLIFGWAYQSHLKALKYFHNKIPVYFRGDSTLLDNEPGLKEKLKTILLRWIYRHVNAVFYPGTNSRQYFMRYGVKRHQLIFAPHAIDNERFAADRHNEASELRRQLAINDKDILILFAGKFEEKKDPLLLLNAFLKLKQPRMHLLFVGNGKLEVMLKQRTAGEANVHFLDFQNQTAMPVMYQAADLFCLPSKGPQESWGLAVNEAMASGCAVLVSDKAGCAIDLVQNTVNGFIFEHGNEDDLFSKLSSLTISRQHLTQLGNESFTIINSWNFAVIAEAIEQKVQEVQI